MVHLPLRSSSKKNIGERGVVKISCRFFLGYSRCCISLLLTCVSFLTVNVHVLITKRVGVVINVEFRMSLCSCFVGKLLKRNFSVGHNQSRDQSPHKGAFFTVGVSKDIVKCEIWKHEPRSSSDDRGNNVSIHLYFVHICGPMTVHILPVEVFCQVSLVFSTQNTPIWLVLERHIAIFNTVIELKAMFLHFERDQNECLLRNISSEIDYFMFLSNFLWAHTHILDSWHQASTLRLPREWSKKMTHGDCGRWLLASLLTRFLSLFQCTTMPWRSGL